MKTTQTSRAGEWRRLAVAVFAAVAMALAACTSTQEPGAMGSITLRFYPANESRAIASPAQTVPDSVVVRVFRKGSGVVQETSRGAAINGAASVDVTVTCLAESGKKVSVELYSSGTMVYFGVNETVDVVEDENTAVMVDAYDIRVDDVAVTDALIEPGELPPDVYWGGVPAADSYLLMESSSPSFEAHLTQSFVTTDTVMTRSRPAGAWYYAVAPLNPYAVGSPSNVAYTYVVAEGEPQPSIEGMSPLEVIPGDRVTLTGVNLDVPGRVWLGTVTCPILSATETTLEFAVPGTAHTGAVSFENLMNTTGAPDILVVDRIAYVSNVDPGFGDWAWYRDLIDGETVLTSGLAHVPLWEVTDRDMGVFDVVIVAHDVGTGASRDQMLAIAQGGAHVLAVGRGGQSYVYSIFADITALGFYGETRQDLYVPEGSLPLFQSPYYIAPPGESWPVMTDSGQRFTGLTIDVAPSSVTTYAALSKVRPNCYPLLDAVATAQFSQPVHNMYWGYEGDPSRLTSTGRRCVANMVVYLSGAKIAVPLASSAALP